MVYRFGHFVLDPRLRSLYRDGELVHITAKGFDTLLVLIQSRGKVVSKDQLLALLWPDTVVEEANLAQNVSTLRKALGDSPKEHRYIATISGRGYSFIAAVTEQSDREDRSNENTVGTDARGHLWINVLAALVPLSGLVWILWSDRDARFSTPEPRNLPLTSLPGTEYMPAFSPDGKRVAFVWSGEHGNDPQIYVKPVEQGTQVRVTKGPGPVSFPCWSPDGHSIAYARELKGGTAYYIVSAIGRTEREIAKTSTNGSGGLDWLPDGKHLVISQLPDGARSSPLLSLAVNSGERRILATPPAGIVSDLNPSVSPDGKALAFVRMTSGDAAHIYLMTLNTGQVRRLTSDGARFGGISWTPDSREIVFSSTGTGAYSLWRLAVASDTLRPILAGGERVLWPAVARRGGRLAYMASRVSDSLWRIKTGSLRKSRVAVSKQVVTSGRTQADPQYSPDGSKIAFTSSRSGSDEIWVSHADGSMAVQLTDLGHPHTGSPHWSPDGTQIVFGSRANGDPDIFVIGSDGGAPRRLTTHAGEDVTPSWSRDGKWIYFASDRSGEFQVWKMPKTGESSAGAVQITHGGGFAPVESRDGKHLYFAKGLGRRGLWRLALKGADNNDKGEQPVLDSLEHWGWWALAKEGVYFFNAQPAGSSGIFFDVQPPPKQKVKLNYLNLATGIRSELTTLDRAVSTCNRVMSVSPSGSDLIYEQLDREDADIMMVENFGTGRN